MDEQTIIYQCSRGNEKAQKLLYDRYADAMFRICLRYTGNSMDAEDVLSTAFYKVFTNIGKFEYRGINSLPKWIKTIMINESLMFLRKHNGKIFESIDNSHLQIADETESDIDAGKIFQLIVALSTGYRTVLNLFIIDGLTHEEIARQLGISINTSKSQLSRARAILKDQLFKLKEHGR